MTERKDCGGGHDSVKFPVYFPVSREFGPETGPIRTASSGARLQFDSDQFKGATSVCQKTKPLKSLALPRGLEPLFSPLRGRMRLVRRAATPNGLAHRLRLRMCGEPQRSRSAGRIEAELPPPPRFITVSMELAMMPAAEWDRELVADFAAERAVLCKA